MCVVEVYESDVELAVEVFKAQEQASINYLKDFLTVLPSPRCIEQVLAAGFYRLAETDPDACCWLVRHPYYLMPELDLIEEARKLAISKLRSQGLVLGRDFRFEPSGRLQISEKAKAGLLVGNSAGDRLLLKEILQVAD